MNTPSSVQTPVDITCGVILIGNELLSGRTADANLNFMAKTLGEVGIRVAECRIIPDIEQTIVDTVNTFKGRFDYVFTTGGIGPTHDDITMASIAKAFGAGVYRDEKVVNAFKAHYGDRATEATFRMCDFPRGATLIECPATVAPGFCMGNVFVMAGIPKIMQAMLRAVLPQLKNGSPIVEASRTAFTRESLISKGLEEIQQRFPQIDLGSYPAMRDGRFVVSLVAHGRDGEAVNSALAQIDSLLQEVGAELIES